MRSRFILRGPTPRRGTFPHTGPDDRHGARTGYVGGTLRRLSRFVLIGVCGLSAAGCGQHATTLHSVRAVKGTFARHGLKLAVIERNRGSTWLIPAAVVSAWRTTPTLARPHAKVKYFIIGLTSRRWIHD